MSDEAEVRGWLAGVAVPPSRLEVDGIVAVARVRVRRRRWLAVGGSTVAVLAALAAVPSVAQVLPPASPSASPSADPPAGSPTVAPASPSPTVAPEPVECAVTVLAPPDGLAERGVVDPQAAQVAAMDPTGRYVVANTYGGRSDSPATVLWDGGEPAIIPTESGHVTSEAVNSSGEVAGYGVHGTEAWYAWVYRDGEVTRLPMPDGLVDVFPAIDINEAGDVVGNLQDRGYAITVVVWPATAPEAPRVLEVPDGTDVSAVAITDDGTVVGNVGGSVGGYLWDPDGVGRELPLPAGATEGGIADARGDWAVGYASFPATEDEIQARILPEHLDEIDDRGWLEDATVPVPVRWDLRTGTVAEVPGYRDNGNFPINSIGFGADAVGSAGTVVVGYPNPQVLRQHPAGREVVLPVPVEDAAPDPVAISDAGDLVAGNVVADDWRDPGDLDAPYGSGTGPGVPSDLPRPVVWRC